MQARIDRSFVTGLAGSRYVQGVEQELQRAAGSLFPIAFLQGFRQFQQRLQSRRPGYDQVPQVGTQVRHEMKGVESF